MIKLINDDCLNKLDSILKKGKVNVIITDLPYGVTQNEIDIPIDLDKLWKIINKYKIPLITTSQQPFTTDLINSNRKGFRYVVYWNKILKSNFLNAKYQPLRQIEEIIIFGKPTYNPQMSIGKPLHHSKSKSKAVKNTNKNYGKLSDFYVTERRFSVEKHPSNLITFQKPKSAVGKPLFHPTEKPLELMMYLVKTYSNVGDVVLDLTMGSGTTGIACLKTNRKFIGIEKNKKYFNIAKKRIKKEKENESNN